MNNQRLIQALSMLGELLDQREAQSYSLVVCGGSALITTGLVTRTTKDIDVLGQYNAEGNVVRLEEFPEPLKKLIDAIGEELGMWEDWINTGPSAMINPKLPNNGLPEGFTDRLLKYTFGNSLTIYFIGRTDQIYFKTYAAVDKGGPTYHLEDLLKLNPSNEEMLSAALWSLHLDPSPGYKQSLIEMYKAIGFSDVTEQI